eukprot:2528058-Pleurochrysis_carterae.AAC.2
MKHAWTSGAARTRLWQPPRRHEHRVELVLSLFLLIGLVRRDRLGAALAVARALQPPPRYTHFAVLTPFRRHWQAVLHHARAFARNRVEHRVGALPVKATQRDGAHQQRHVEAQAAQKARALERHV